MTPDAATRQRRGRGLARHAVPYLSTNPGIDKVVLLAPMQQLDVERGLATRLAGVDLIIAGGSNTGLYDGDDLVRAGDTDRGDHPLAFTSPGGEPVLLVNVDADYKYLGRIVLPFAGGGDAYPFTALVAADRVDLVMAATKAFATPGAEQDALARFLAAGFPRSMPYAQADVAANEDARIQNLSLRTDGLPQD